MISYILLSFIHVQTSSHVVPFEEEVVAQQDLT
jgi:hypothetical protein